MSSSPANASRNPSVALSRNGSTTGGSTLGSPNPRRPKDGSPKFQRKTPTLASQLVAKVRAGDLLLPKCNELEKRMIKGEEERVARDAAGEDDVEVQDPIEMTMQDMLCMAASDREAQHRDSIATFIELNAPAWASQFTDERIKAVAASCLYHFFQPGSTVCEAEEDTALCAPPAPPSLAQHKLSLTRLVCAPHAATLSCSPARCRSRSRRSTTRRA